jgi:hypothetical protein
MGIDGWWTWISRAKEISSLVGVLIVIAVFAYSKWLSTPERLVWGICFWPKAVTWPFIRGQSGEGEKVLLSVRTVLVNASIFPQMIEDAALIVTPPGSSKAYAFSPYVFMEAEGFTQEPDGVWKPRKIELSRPFAIEPRSESARTWLFIPDRGNQMNDLVPGKYHAVLSFKRLRRKPIQLAIDLSLDESITAGFLEGSTGVALLSRDLAVTAV